MSSEISTLAIGEKIMTYQRSKNGREIIRVPAGERTNIEIHRFPDGSTFLVANHYGDRVPVIYEMIDQSIEHLGDLGC